jgi:hypothetical protein
VGFFRLNLVFQDYSVAKEDNARILRAMTVSGSPDDLCPALSYLGYGHPGYVFSQEVFLSMIRSRFCPDRGGALSSLRLFSSIGDYFLRDVMDSMQTQMDDGLNASIVDNYRMVDSSLYLFVLP